MLLQLSAGRGLRTVGSLWPGSSCFGVTGNRRTTAASVGASRRNSRSARVCRRTSGSLGRSGQSARQAGADQVRQVRQPIPAQPNHNADGTYSWVLRHGVTIQLDSAGLVRAICEPDGHAVSYLRDGNRHLAESKPPTGGSSELPTRMPCPSRQASLSTSFTTLTAKGRCKRRLMECKSLRLPTKING